MVELGIFEREWSDEENGYNYHLTEYGKTVNKKFEDEKDVKIQRDLFGVLGVSMMDNNYENLAGNL